MKKQKKKSTNSALSSTSKKPYAQNKDTAEGSQSLRAMVHITRRKLREQRMRSGVTRQKCHQSRHTTTSNVCCIDKNQCKGISVIPATHHEWIKDCTHNCNRTTILDYLTNPHSQVVVCGVWGVRWGCGVGLSVY